jgi:hypothetical protein
VISSRHDVSGLCLDVDVDGVGIDVDDVGINTNAIVDLWAFSFASSSLFIYIFHHLVHTFLAISAVITAAFITAVVITILNPRQDARPNAPQPARNDRLPLLGATLVAPDVCAADAAACCRCCCRWAVVTLGLGMGGTAVDVRALTAVFAGAARRATRVGDALCAAHQPFGVLDEFEGRGEERDVRRACGR